MRTISLSIEDARYASPTLEIARVRDHKAARKIAHDRLQASPYHLAVKVREDDELLFWLRRLHAEGQESQACHAGV
jgi:hypothetical protein